MSGFAKISLCGKKERTVGEGRMMNSFTGAESLEARALPQVVLLANVMVMATRSHNRLVLAPNDYS